MVGQHLIDEGLLPLQCFQCAATGDSVVVQRWIDDFREQFGGGAKAMSASPIPAIQGLAEDKLAAIGGVAEVQPVSDATSPAHDFRLARLASSPSIDAADHNVDVGYVGLGCQE